MADIVAQIRSKSNPDKVYTIRQDLNSFSNQYTCDCPDFMYRRKGTGQDCKHIKEIKEEIENAEKILNSKQY